MIRSGSTWRGLLSVQAAVLVAMAIGAVVVMTFKAAVDQPQRFARSNRGAHFGLTPRKYQTGDIDRTGRISKMGDAMVRTSHRVDQFARVRTILRISRSL